MSQENVDFLWRTFEAWDRGGDTWVAMLRTRVHPEFELHTLYPGQVYRGADGVRDFSRELSEIWDQYSLEPEDIVDLGDHVLVLARMSGRGVGSGVPIARRIFVLWRFDGATAIESRAFASRDEALEAAGLSE
jgi:ketosteroid isomerase-like protein